MAHGFFTSSLVQKELCCKRLEVTRDLQAELTELFSAQRDDLLGARDHAIPFSPGTMIDEDELFVVRDFDLPTWVRDAVRHADTLDRVAAADIDAGFRSIFAADRRARQVLFQRFTRRQVLARSFPIFLAKDTFTRAEGAGLLLDTKLAAVFDAGALYFASFPAARAVVPELADLYQEATDDQLLHFASSPRIAIDDPAAFVAQANSWTRKRIAMLLQEGTLDHLDPAAVRTCAKNYDLPLELVRNGKTPKLRLPTDRHHQKLAIKLLCDELLISELTSRRYAVPGKRRIGPPSS